MSLPRIFLALSVLALIVSLNVSFGGLFAQAANSSRSTLVGSAPTWANSKNYQSAANPTIDVGFRVYLGWNNPSAVEALAQAVSDPKSPSYGQYLTPQQFRQQFAPSQSQVGAVQSWLKSQGFSVEYTPMNNHYVSAEGTVAQAQAAFGASFGIYSVGGLGLRSPSADVSIPNSLANIVTGVIGLDDSVQFVHMDNTVGDAPPPPAFVSAHPCSSYWGQLQAVGFTNPYGPGTLPFTPCGYTPQEIKGAYGISGFDGSGQTVAIIDAYASPTILQDVNQWSTNRGLPTMRPSQLVQVVPPGVYNRPQNPRQDPQGWYVEETLDVEAVHGMAPAAKIVFVGAPNNYQDLDAAMNHVVDGHLAQIVTNSVCSRNGWLYGAGGGVSVVFADPFYQQTAGLTLTGRGVPDVAALADPQTGLLIGQTQTFPNGASYDEYRLGGTSLASPIFAGLMALADQKAGHPHGFANPLFYANPSAFYDVTSVKTAVARRNYVNGVDASNGTVDRLRTLDDYSGSPTQHTNPGWDNVTGLGTPGSAFLSLIGQ